MLLDDLLMSLFVEVSHSPGSQQGDIRILVALEVIVLDNRRLNRFSHGRRHDLRTETQMPDIPRTNEFVK